MNNCLRVVIMAQQNISNINQSAGDSSVNFPYLYHFTDESNLQSILKHGLLSWYQLDRLGLSYNPGSNDLSRYLDSRKNLEDYVRLCLNTSHPMMWFCLYNGRINKVRWLKISQQVWRFADNLYSDTNAASSCARIISDPFNVIKKGDNQAEVLVKTRIDPRLITVL